MSLRDQFASDLATVFMDTGEFATEREFRISDGEGGFKVFTCPVIWDEEAAKQEPVVTVHGVFMGSVFCYIERKYLPRSPVAGEIIYSPANQPWEVLRSVEAEGLCELALNATRSQPAMYGKN